MMECFVVCTQPGVQMLLTPHVQRRRLGIQTLKYINTIQYNTIQYITRREFKIVYLIIYYYYYYYYYIILLYIIPGHAVA
jgi:hypothetical protein